MVGSPRHTPELKYIPYYPQLTVPSLYQTLTSFFKTVYQDIY